ncbi:MAG: hypothetical protein KGL34_10745 [Gammaproteobacteria bacterium]|nr:hypothetical protein [Gammaproteobacteria bacterium]
MNSLKKCISYALAAAAAAGVYTNANALPISNYASNASTNVNVYLSGSTAIDNTLLNETIETTAPGGICQAGTLDVYYIGTSATSYTNRMFYCSASAQSGLAAGTPLAIFKESNVGSANGVQPLISAAQGAAPAIQFINPAAIAADGSCATAATVAAGANTASYTNHTGCNAADTSAQTPTGGFADVEANILRDANGNAFNNIQVGQYLKLTPDIDVVWAIAVTKNFYYALQAAEHLADGTVIASCNVANNDAAACTPSLTKAQIAGIFSGNLVDSRELGVANGTTGDTGLYLCRRDKGSGTEASFEAYFLGQRCSSLVNAPMLNEATSTTDVNYPFVWANPSTSSIRKCLQGFFAGATTLSAYYTAGLTYTTAGNQYAIGIMSSEVKPTDISGAGDSYRLVAIDGVLPTLANAINGFYPYWSSGAAYQVKAGFAGAPSGAPLTVLNNVVKLLGEPAWLAQSDATYVNTAPFLHGGDLAPADQYFASNPPTLPATNASSLVTPTNAFTKNGSNCNTPIPKGGATAITVLQSPTEGVLLGTGGVNPTN